jgi:hypothetical protein
MGRSLRAAVFLAVGVLASPVFAQEQIVPLAVSGQWMAMARKENVVAPPDVCMVVNSSAGVGFRADRLNVEFRVIDKSWSLPAAVKGSILISLPGYEKEFPIFDNDATMISVLLGRDGAEQLIDVMDKAGTMTVRVGKAAPKSISLAGSTIATNAFRTCARLRGANAGPGTNPFR